jgi:putative FmdB family regulatory protein
MPTYDYVCNACGHEFELFQPMSESPKKKCPECGKLKLERLIGAGAGVIFKGGGFYETDYRTESYKKGADAEKKASEGDKPNSKKPDTNKKTDTTAKKTADSKPEKKESPKEPKD